MRFTEELPACRPVCAKINSRCRERQVSLLSLDIYIILSYVYNYCAQEAMRPRLPVLRVCSHNRGVSMIALITSGGVLMIPLALCALAATFIIFERLFYFISVRRRDAELSLALNQLLPKLDYNAAIRACSAADTPLSLVTRKALECRRLCESEIEDIAASEAGVLMPRYEHLLTALGTIANVSTMLGLLGTVTGTIQAFGVFSRGGALGDPAQLSSAVAQALVTTAAGLVIAIPSVIFHNCFVSETNKAAARIEAAVTQLIYNLKKGV